MITQQTIQQIQSRIDVVEVVGSFVKLKKRGVNYIGLCPFHNEKSPSFSVSPTKEIYKCFGCGKSGNSISFLMEHEKYSYVEALRWLANKYNVEIEETEVSPELRAQYQVADSLYIINQFAQQYFSEKLFDSEEGEDIAMSYLKERGFREEIIRKFQIGYCLQDRDAFAKAAIAAQYNPEYLQKSGLIVVRDERPYDNYRGRIIFPIHNQSGKVLGFGARVIGKVDRAPKYINTPENEIYHKSKILYGSYFARQSIDKNDECLLVEGYTDVVSLHQAGIENVVASGGTPLTPDQLRLVKKYTKNLTIIYDGDAAGVKAALRGLDLALEEGLNVKLVLIPDKEDPDSYVNKIGATAFQDFIKANKKDFILFQVEILLKDAGDDTNKKAALVNQIAETIAKLNKAEDFTKQQDYIRRCADLLRIEEVGLNNLVNKFIRDKVQKQEGAKPFQQQQSDDGHFYDEGPPPFIPEEDAGSLFNKDEMNERGMVNHDLFPLFCLSAERNMGSGRLMGFIDNVCPSANEMRGSAKLISSQQDLLCDAAGPACLFIYKTVSEPHVGELSFFKVYSGTIKSGMELVNETTGTSEKLNQLFAVEGNKRINVPELVAGDIGATLKLKNTHVNNTLHEKGKNVELEPIVFPAANMSMAIESVKKGEEEKLSVALHQLPEEDPTVRVEFSQELKQTIIHCLGELHLSVIRWRIEHLHGVEVKFTRPRIPYRETIRRMAESSYRHKKQSGGNGQFGEVFMRIEPWYEGMPDPKGLNVRGREEHALDWGGKLVYYNCIVGGAIDTRFLPSILKGVMEKMHEGPQTGSFVRDVRVSVYDGKMHPVDSNDISFKIAGLMAFKQAFAQADPQILEPIYHVEVLCPDDLTGSVIGDLQTRRAIVEGMDAEGHFTKIMAKVPLAEMHDYSSSLRSITQGRAKFNMKFDEYAAVPGEIQKKLQDDYHRLAKEEA